MMKSDEWQERLERLEMNLAWQDEVIETLNQVVSKMQTTIDLQQKQLQLLYKKININQSNTEESDYFQNLIDNIPPHY